MSYYGYGNGPPPSLAPNSLELMKQQQYLEYLNRFRLEDPLEYRKWYEKYKANPKKPPPLPGFGQQHYLPLGTPTNYPGYNHHTLPRGSTPSSVFNSYGPPGGMYLGYPSSNNYHPHYGGDRGYGTAPGVAGSRTTRAHFDNSRAGGSGRSSVTDFYPQTQGAGDTSFSDQHSLPPYDSAYNFMPIAPDDGMSVAASSYMHSEYKEPTPERMTPLKFPTPHAIARFDPCGHLLVIKCEEFAVEVQSIRSIVNRTDEFQQIEQFPGPLVRGKVHKTTVIQYCQKKIKEACANDNQVDRENFILIWEYLIQLLRQNGTMVGSDVSEILLSKVQAAKEQGKVAVKSEDRVEAGDGEPEEKPETLSAVQNHDPFEKHVSEERLVKTFSDHLLCGHTKEALDYATRNNLWGHALVLASKMGESYYKSVMNHFVGKMKPNDPLVTLYEVMGGKLPTSARKCCDEYFGDWKPHLAMILSNTGFKTEVETKSIVAMGDTLKHRNFVYGSQFCYLMAQVEFSTETKLGPMIGLAPDKSNIIEATQMSEVYEFARTLAEPNFSIGSDFLPYKLDYIKLLINYGFAREANSYCEELAKRICRKTLDAPEVLSRALLEISERLRLSEDDSNSSEEADGSWALEFKNFLNTNSVTAQVNNFQTHNNVEEEVLPNPVIKDEYTPNPKKNAQIVQDSFVHETDRPPLADHNSDFIEHSITTTQQQINYEPKTELFVNSIVSDAPRIDRPPMYVPNSFNNYVMPDQNFRPPPQEDFVNTYPIDLPMPVGSQPPNTFPIDAPISIERPVAKTFPIDTPVNGSPVSGPSRISENGTSTARQAQKDTSKAEPKKEDAKKKSSWFPNILPSFKPKNQMILPDDKDPSIVWDDTKKRWVNKDGNEDGDNGPAKPPPKDFELNKNLNNNSFAPPPRTNSVPNFQLDSSIGPNPVSYPSMPANPSVVNQPMSHNNPAPAQLNFGAPQPPVSTNIYKLQRGRTPKNSYVDVVKNQGMASAVGSGHNGKSQSHPMLPMFTPGPPPLGYDSNQPGYFTPGGNSNGILQQPDNQEPQ